MAKRLNLLVLGCFFLSGFTGLIYEILWRRMIVKIVGGAPFAVSIVLTVFMGGLGIGSYLASRRIDRIKSSGKLVRIYGVLELVVAGYALLLPVLLAAFKPVYAAIYNRLFNYFMLYSFLTLVGCAAFLLLPVICMGATLPILCRYYVTQLGSLGARTGRLYGLNTIGAALGALACGFWLIAVLGVWATVVVAVAINVAIGVVCVLAGSSSGDSAGNGTALEAASRNPASGERRDVPDCRQSDPFAIAALVLLAVSGFCSMAYEVIWTKLLGLIVGPTTYSFTIVLVTFILGLALGSIVFGWLGDRTGKPLVLLLATQIVAAVSALGVSHLLGNSQFFFAKLLFHFQSSFVVRSTLKAVALFLFMFGPTVCLGASFPLAGKIYTRAISRLGRSVGFAYAMNTVGAVLGSFCAGFLLVPLVGKEVSLRLVAAVQLVAALVVLVRIMSLRGHLRWCRALALCSIAGLALTMRFPKWNRIALSFGRYHRFVGVAADIRAAGWFEALFDGPEIITRREFRELVYYGDGMGGFTTVLSSYDPFGNEELIMANSGKADASSRGDMSTQTLSAHFPLLFHENPKKVMVLGLASGVTAGEILHYPIERLDVIEISKQVVEASEFFRPWNNNVLSDRRTNLIIQDGRAHLALTRTKYDVIISEPSNPWMAGLATLFTREFFALARDRLNDEGVFLQFFHAYQMDWDTFALVGRTFSSVFGNALMLVTSPSTLGVDYLLVGYKGKERLNLGYAEENLARSSKSPNMSLSDPRLLYRLIVSERLDSLFGPGPLNTDSDPVLEYAAPKLIYRDDREIIERIKSRRYLAPGTQAIFDEISKDIDAQLAFAEFAFSVYLPFPGMVDFARANVAQKERFFEMLQGYAENNRVASRALKDEALEERCWLAQIKSLAQRIDSVPDKARSWTYLGILYRRVAHFDKSERAFRKALAADPAYADARYGMGMMFEQKRDWAKAIDSFTAALRIWPNHVASYRGRGGALARMGRLPEAVADYRTAVRLEPDNAENYSKLSLALMKSGDDAAAIDGFRKALELKPDLLASVNNLAWLLAACRAPSHRDPAESIRLAKRASELTDYKKPAVLDTLAVALASAGHFEKAAGIARKAAALAREAGDTEQATQLDAHVKLFEAGRAYVEK